MSTRITNSGARLALASLLWLSPMAASAASPKSAVQAGRGRGAGEEAAAHPAEGAAGKRGAGRRRAARGDQAARGLPEREPARVGGLPLERSGRGAVQAGRALLGRVEGGLPGEDGRLPSGRQRLPRRSLDLPPRAAPSAHHRSGAGPGGLPAAHQRVPEVPQDRHGHLPVCVLAARPEQGRRVDQVLPDHPRSLPQVALRGRRLDGHRRVPVLRAAELPDARWKPTRRC